VYAGPLHLPLGGTIQSAVLTADGKLGLVASKTIVGVAPTAWKVVPESSTSSALPGFPADQAIDADAGTLWKSEVSTPDHPPRLTIDLGATQRIGGFAYLPRQDWVFEGVVDRYRFETSVDGQHWTQAAEGLFGNIRNNPMLQEVSFAPVEARFIRFTALHDVENTGTAGVAELTVLPAK
jgi:alpha-L-fucosidase